MYELDEALMSSILSNFDSNFLEFEYKASSAFAICIFADSSEFGVCASAKENIH